MTDLTPILLAFALGALAVALCGVFVVWTHFVPRSKYEALEADKNEWIRIWREHAVDYLSEVDRLEGEADELCDKLAAKDKTLASAAKVIHTLKDQVARLNGRRDAKGRWMKVTK